MGQLAMLIDLKWKPALLGESNIPVPAYEAYKEYVVGEEFFNRHEHKRAIEHFNKAIALDPDFIYPLFVTEGKQVKNPIASMPGNYQYSIDQLINEIKDAHELGVPALILFGTLFTLDFLVFLSHWDFFGC